MRGSKRKKHSKEVVTRGAFESLESRQMLAAHIVGSNTNYATIQAAVNAAAVGAIINVDAGTYNETVTVNKTLTLRGAQFGKDARNARGAETRVFAVQTVFDIFANDVTIDGFTIEGNRADIGAKLGAGVLMEPLIHGTQVLNNIVQDNVTGIYLSNNSNTDACVIQHNLIQNNFEKNNNWATKQWNGSRGIYTDGAVSGGFLTNVVIDANRVYNADYYGGDEDMGIISFQALGPGKQFNIVVSNNYIGNDSKGILATNVTNLTVIGNTFVNCNDGSSGPVRFEGNCNVVNIQYNNIVGNSGPGVAIDNSGVGGDSSGFVINYNNIYNTGGKIGVITVAAQYIGMLTTVGDYWGSATGPSGNGPGTGSSVWANGQLGHGVTPKGLAGGQITFSPWATAAIDITKIPAPAAPTGLSVAASSASSVQLSWTPQMTTATSQLIQRSTDGVNFTTIATVSPLLNTFADSGLIGGTKYTYRIVASNATGNTNGATAFGTTLPAAGGSVPLSALTWTSATTGYASVQKNLSVIGNAIKLAGITYQTGLGTHAVSAITYALGGQYTNFSAVVGIDDEVNNKGVGSVIFQVFGDGKVLFNSGALTNGQTKAVNVDLTGLNTLQLIANNGVANSIDYDHADWANAMITIGSALPTAPSNLTAKLNTNTVALTWTAGTNLTGYTVQRSSDGTNFSSIASGLSATSYTDGSTLAQGTTYTYRVLATNSQGNSSPSNTASITTLPVGTLMYALGALTPTSASTGYGSVMINKSVNGNPLMLNGTTYAYGIGVHAVSNLVYNLGGQFTTFQSDVGVDDEENGKGIGSVIFRVIGDGKVLFDSGVVQNGVAPAHIAVDVTGVQILQLVATNGVANSIDYDHADWAGAILTGTPVAPSAPSNLVATALTSSSVKLTWPASGTSVASYSIDRSTDNATWTTITTKVTGTATSWIDPTALSASTDYYYRIRASNLAGDSPNSSSAKVTTPVKQTVTYLSDLTATSATAGYGTVQKDKSILGDLLSVGGVTYTKGLGTHTSSTITYNLNGAYKSFVSIVGIDDEVNAKGTGAAQFQVFADGVLVFDSGVLTNSQTASIAVNLLGVKTLTLIAGSVNDNIDYAHADWANAQMLS